MPILNQFLDDLVDLAGGTTITIESWATHGTHNQPTYGSPVSYTAQVSGPVKYWHRDSQQERVSLQTVVIFSAAEFSTRDRITLPAGYDVVTTTPKIAQVDRVTDEQGFCFSTLYLA